MQVEKQRAGGVARVGEVERAAGQLPQQPGVNRAEGQFAALRPLPGARHMVQQPADLAAGEVGVNDQARLARDQVAVAGALEIVAEPGRPAVLPDDGVMDGLAGPAVPDDRRLALIGDADGGDVSGPQSGAGQRRPGDFELAGPNLQRVMLDPAGLGKVLGKLLLGAGADCPRVIKQDRARTRRALIQC